MAHVAPFAVLADSTRSRIARLLLDAPGGRASVTALADALGLRQPTVSHHLARLREAGLVLPEKEGRRVWYSLVADERDRIAGLVAATTAQAGTGAAAGNVARGTVPFDRDRAVERLCERFRGVHSRETVAALLDESLQLLERRAGDGAGGPLGPRAVVFAASRLESIARTSGASAARTGMGTPGRASVSMLFVCVRNAGRSQLAAGIMRQLAGDRVIVQSAGSEPAPELSAGVVRALAEIGVPVGDEFPKPLTDEAVRAADVIVTMGCGDACPVYPGRRYLDWDLPDPHELPLEDVRGIRDEVEARVRALLFEVMGGVDAGGAAGAGVAGAEEPAS
ncbi:hypothetical protein GCM10011490_00900 [Pseudoclavibacter endophyticus]|uniref:Metalloregulator ArsR/SmtB family transcription factor n=1 Tax=Pseudoclavibacter endophyticus TaxID=1778590 RepID=A0A6H9WHB5_9MICO|nr:metalloregulator ArsR/SmtB family transcription factor [Pseudoclavibacter endophyticus]KAB1650349.1 metalloregulator ArsR/SmtB family transcription factor [Pseudoclavibacter endophyticus]GGA54907.1 hypothetical protein GCM10011490_00900 [Pseudoclavibacter endophyticus]